MVKQSIFYSVIFLTVILSGCSSKSNEEKHHEITVNKHRKQTEIDLLTDKIIDPKNFNGLNYFPPQLKYKIIAAVERIEPQKIEFSTNTDRVPIYYKYCKLTFKINDTTCLLYGYTQEPTEKSDLFIPFKDLSNSNETYAAGRYIEMGSLNHKDSIEIDFNYAFNPYCHYNSNFSCPIVPIENHLKSYILAGEKKIH